MIINPLSAQDAHSQEGREEVRLILCYCIRFLIVSKLSIFGCTNRPILDPNLTIEYKIACFTD